MDQKSVQIIQGGQKSFVVRLVDSETGDPYDLTAATEVETCFENDDGTELMLNLAGGVTILNAIIGKIQISLTAAQTTALRVLQGGTLELAVTFAGDPVKIQIPLAYDVVQTAC